MNQTSPAGIDDVTVSDIKFATPRRITASATNTNALAFGLFLVRNLTGSASVKLVLKIAYYCSPLAMQTNDNPVGEKRYREKEEREV